MDHCIRLSKSIKQDFFNEFSTYLTHWGSKLADLHRWLLLFDVINCGVSAPSKYIDLILKHPVEINKPYKSHCKNKYPQFVGKNPLMLACQMLNFQAVLSLLRYEDILVGSLDALGNNCLFYALRNQSEEDCYKIVSAIIKRDPALVNSTNHKGVSLLVEALQKKSLRLVQLLLNNSADPNQRDKSTGNTALHKALLHPHNNSQKKKDIILLLLNFKADPCLQNLCHKNSFDVAKQVNFEVGWLHQLYRQSQQPQDGPVFCHEELVSVTKEDQDSVIGNISSEMSDLSDQDEEEFSVDRLNGEIQGFAKNCEKIHVDSWKDIEYVYSYLHKIGESLNLKIDIIGSYATGLWTPHSDIDIVYTNLDSQYISIQDMLTHIYQILKCQSTALQIKDLYLNKNTNVNLFPNIKLELTEQLHYLKIDITIFQKKNNGQKYVHFIQQHMGGNPYIRPVFFVLHKLLQQFGIDNPAKNGLKTYAIFLLILMAAERFKSQSSGELFMNTVYFYAHCFVYEDSAGLPRINIYDPLNEFNNVGGRKTDVNRLRLMFKAVDYGLRLATGNNILEGLFGLSEIFQN